MRLLSRVSSLTVASPRATTISDYNQAFFSGDALPNLWMSNLAAAGVAVSPDLAMTLSAFYAGVTTIAYDLSTLPPQVYRNRDDGGKDRVRPRVRDIGGMGDLAYKLRWQPNDYQSSAEFFFGMLSQYLMRSRCYAEIVPDPMTGFLGALLPRHPDRVTPERLPNGRLRYKLNEGIGKPPRYVTQDEMFVVRESFDGALNGLGRVDCGANTLGTILAAERAAGKFYKSGMTASTLATYKSADGNGMSEEEEDALHKSMSRYATGVENSFGLLLVPDNVTVSNLAIEPEKAQMMLAREWGVQEIARMLRLPGYKLGIKGTTTYASQVQSAVDYVIGCLRPIAVTFEQAFQMHLVLDKDAFFVEFLLDALLRGDPDARAAYYERAIRNRWMRPSEVRLRENLNPDPELDRLSAGDFRPGANGGGSNAPKDSGGFGSSGTNAIAMHSFLLTHDNAQRCVKRERAAVARIAAKCGDNVEGYRAELREFYTDHAQFVARTMRLPMTYARGYSAQHGSVFEAQGAAFIDGASGDSWERDESTALAELAVNAIGAHDAAFVETDR